MIKRYTQPCVQTQPGLEFRVAEVELFEDAKGKWVRFEDIKHLLPEQQSATVTRLDPTGFGMGPTMDAVERLVSVMRRNDLNALRCIVDGLTVRIDEEKP